MTEVRLSSFNTGNFNKGAGFIKQTLWYFVNALFVRKLPGILLWE